MMFDTFGLQDFRNVHVFVPARMDSQRLPGKLALKDGAGRTILRRVVETCCRFVDELVTHEAPCGKEGWVDVCCPSWQIAEVWNAVGENGWGVRIVTSDKAHKNGTERIAAAAARQNIAAGDIILHVQADMPGLQVSHLWALLKTALQFPVADLATIASRTITSAELINPSAVKVRVGDGGFAYQFTRKPVTGAASRHVGLYAYRASYLQWYAGLPDCRGLDEDLEQYRVLAAGGRVRVGYVPDAPKGIDTEADWAEFLAAEQKGAHPFKACEGFSPDIIES